MVFKKVEITKQNSTDITVLENAKIWFTSGVFTGKITLHINELVFTNLRLCNAFWIPDNMIDFKTNDDSKDIFMIKVYL